MGIIISYCFSDDKKTTYAPTLPEELIQFEILNRLPVKSLVRLQCVCKSWQSLISSHSEFLKSHFVRATLDPDNDYCALLLHPRKKVTNTKFHHPLLSKDLHIVGSINGLVCIYIYEYASHSIECFGIWNPATNMYKNIPAPSSAVNIHIHNLSVGFGYDPISNDYKVVFVRTIPYSPLVADVYSCNADSWGKNKVTSSFVSTYYVVVHPTIVNGCPYWANMEENNVKTFVISFDIRKEVFKVLPGPDFVDVSKQYSFVINCKECLTLIVAGRGSFSTLVDVYIFEEESNGAAAAGAGAGVWSKKCTVGPIEHMDFLQCFKNGDILFKDGNKFQLIYLDNRHDNMCIFPHDTSDFKPSYRPQAAAYIETLVSVNGMKRIQFNTDLTNIVIIER